MPRPSAFPYRLVLAVTSSVAAAGLGFFACTPAQAERLIHRFGYYGMAGTFVWFVVAAVAAWRESRNVPTAEEAAIPPVAGWRGWIQRPWFGPAVVVAGATLLCLLAEPARAKVLYDEYVLQATALQMHWTREVGTLVRGYDINGVFMPIDAYLDKRPYFFPFVLSLVHDLTGYRPGNVYWLNAALTPAVLALIHLLASRLTSRRGGMLAVALLGPLPLLAQNTTGAGMELLNLAMLLLAIWLGTLAAERPTASRLGVFVLAVVLLAESRYESALYVGSAAVVLGVIWWREKRLLLPWAVIAAPLLLIPVALHQLVLTSNRALWELPKNLDSRFSADHVAGNVGHALSFLFSTAREIPNSVYLTALGTAGLLLAAGHLVLRPVRSLTSPVRWVLAAFSLGIFTNLGLLMFYFWGGLDDPLVSRLALPFLALLALLGAGLAAYLDRFFAATRFALVGSALAVVLIYGRVTPLHLYSAENLIAAEVNWELGWVKSRPAANRLILTNKSCLPWLLEHTPSMLLDHIRKREPQLRFHLEAGTFGEILVMQRLRPTTRQGDLRIDPADALPANFELELLAEHRFGITLARISRLRALHLPSVSQHP